MPRIIRHRSVMNSAAYTKLTRKRPDVQNPATNIIEYVNASEWLKIRPTIDRTPPTKTDPTKNHLRPNLSANGGTIRVDSTKPLKKIEPIMPIERRLLQTRSSGSTQLCNDVLLL